MDDSIEAPYRGPVRTLAPTRIRVLKFPRLAAQVLLGAMAVGALAPSSRGEVGHPFWIAALLVGILACCAIGAWAEQRVYRALVGANGLVRLGLTLMTPVAFLFLWAVMLVAGALVSVFDDGVLLIGVVVGGFWFLSASLGTIVIVGLDILISALILDFRSRIQMAVLGFLAVALGASWTVIQVGLAGAAKIREAATNGTLPRDVSFRLGDEVLQGQRALELIGSAETERFIAIAFAIVAGGLGLPAIVNACGKLADAVMERLNPLREAMEKVGQGELNVRVEVGGSRDMRQISEGFNAMASSLSTTLRDLDVRNRELVETNQATSRFVPFQFLDLLDRKTIRDLHRGDQARLNMSVMFGDIRNFTTMAERIGPEETFAFINRYLSEMEAEIHRERGFINDFFGDGIMALFYPGADAAVRAGLGMISALKHFNESLSAEGEAPIRIGIGIDTGALMLGTIGGKERLSCTVVGDVANMAARVEGMTKLYRVSLLISHGTYAQLEDTSRYEIREIDYVQAKGKTKPASIYEVLDGLPDEERRAKLDTRTDFTEALRIYRQGDFENALVRFERCVDRAPDDGVATLYVERCRRMLKNGSPTAWDTVTRLETK